MRSHGVLNCPTCGALFTAHRVNQRYCKPEHRPTPTPTRSKTERGYGADHQAVRLKWKHRLEAGEYIECHARICLMPSRVINPAEPWDLGHTEDRTDWTGPEHPRCNRTEPQFRGKSPRAAGALEHWNL